MRLRSRLVVGLALVIAVWAEGTSPAFATFTKTATGSTSFTAHRLTAPTLTCGLLGIGSVKLNWTATADISESDIYGSGFLASGFELLRRPAAGGPYVQVYSGGLTSFTQNTSGNFFYAVRTFKLAWDGPLSAERHAAVTLGLLGTCS